MQLSKDIDAYLSSIQDTQQAKDCLVLVELIQCITKEPPKMWGSIIGFGDVHYKYPSGREGDTMIIGLAARKQAITIYGLIYYDKNQEYLKDLGKYSTGKGCLYIKRLSDVNMTVLEEMIKQAWKNPVLGQ